MKKENVGYVAISFVSLVAVVSVLMLDPIAQDPHYHAFKDYRTIIGIPNFWNVISNLPFLLVGAMGLYSMLYLKSVRGISEIKSAYMLFFVGVSLVAFGSGYYHLWPSNQTLVWDRLPMTIAFMALFSIIIAEFSSLRLGKLALWPLVFFGGFSVVYWHITEMGGHGDLRLYALVQYLPMILIPLILLLFKPSFSKVTGYWLLMFAYVLAKLFEHYDEAIYHLFSFISGHSLKHIIAAVGVFYLLRSYNNRALIQ